MQETTQSLTFRVGDATTNDYDQFAALLNVAAERTINGDTLRSWDAYKIADDIHFRYAACLNEQVIGYGIIFKGRFRADAVICARPGHTGW